MSDFVRDFGRIILEHGWHVLPTGEREYGWRDNSWLKTQSSDEWRKVEARRRKAINEMIAWDRLRDSDFEIGWWRRFDGSFAANPLVQLICVSFPVKGLAEDPIEWAAEMDLATAIQEICTGMRFRDRWDFV